MAAANLSKRQQKCFVQWLGIPAEECPPHHYRLLGIETYESDRKTILDALDSRRELVRSAATESEQRDLAAIEKVLNSVQSILMDQKQKDFYDSKIRELMSPQQVASAKSASGTAVKAQPQQPAQNNSNSGTAGTTQTASAKKPQSAATKPKAATTVEHDAAGNDTAEHREPQESKSSSRWADQPNRDAPAAASDKSHAEAKPSKKLSPVLLVMLISNLLLVAVVASFLLGFWNRSPESVADAGDATNREVIDSSTNPAPSDVPPTEDAISRDVDSGLDSPEVPPSGAMINDPSVDSEADPSMPDSEPTEPEKPAFANDPFSDLAKEFDLPPIPTAGQKVSDSVTPGNIDGAIDGLQIEFDSSVAQLGGKYEFVVEPTDEREDGNPLWRVLVAPKENQPGTKTQLGFFAIIDGSFRFFWDMQRPPRTAVQLRNALVTLTLNEHRHTMQLRTEVHEGRIAMMVEGESVSLPIDVTDLPDSSDLVLRIPTKFDGKAPPFLGQLKELGWDAAPNGSESPNQTSRDLKFDNNADSSNPGDNAREPGNPAVPNGGVGGVAGGAGLPDAINLRVGESFEIVIDKDAQVGLDVSFQQDETGQCSVNYTIHEKTNRRPVPADPKRLLDEIRKLNLTLSKWVGEFVAGSGDLGRMTVRLAQITPVYQAEKAKRNPNLVLLNRLEGEMFDLNARIKRVNSLLKRHSKGIPTGYNSLAKKLSLYRALTRLHNDAEIQFHLLGASPTAVLRLFSADDQPNVVRKEVEVLPFMLPGRWLRFDQGMFYQLTGDNNGGTIVVTKPLDLEFEPLRGRWTRNEQTEEVTIRMDDGTTERYKLNEDILMSNGVTSVYRQLQ